MICSQCQTTNTDTAKFCRNCGALLRNICTRCGAVLAPEDRFCTSCGQPVNSAPAGASAIVSNQIVASSGGVSSHLTTLEAADLIRLSQVEPNLEYLFRHALVQDAAYESLLRSDRQRLHLVVGQILERIYPERLDELAPVLGHHFYEAGSPRDAQKYFALAGDNARRRFANAEAIAHYTRAIEVAAPDDQIITGLYRSRGIVYETSGDFDHAHADYDRVRQIGHKVEDRRAEWQGLLDLGMLWAARDYEQADIYLQGAFELARQLDDPATLAYSLNRIGNWHVNHDEPLVGQRFHREALEIFQQLGDRRGIATTLDLLGMASLLGCDIQNGMVYFREAIKLFEELGDLTALTSSLVGTTLPVSGHPQSNLMVSQEIDFDTAMKSAERSLAIAREIGYRAGEAFALSPMAWGWSSRGDMTRGLEYARRAYAIAEEIQHRQWMTLTLWAIGIVYFDFFSYKQAQEHLLRAFQLAQEIRSSHWLSCSGGLLASTYARLGQLSEAEALMRPLLAPTLPVQSIGQRFLWTSHAELALARGDTASATHSLDYLVQNTLNLDARGEGAILRVALIRGQILTRDLLAGHEVSTPNVEHVENILQTAQGVAYSGGAVNDLWRLRAVSGQLYRALGRQAEAEQESAAAQAIVIRLAANIQDESLRQTFLDGATTYIRH